MAARVSNLIWWALVSLVVGVVTVLLLSGWVSVRWERGSTVTQITRGTFVDEEYGGSRPTGSAPVFPTPSFRVSTGPGYRLYFGLPSHTALPGTSTLVMPLWPPTLLLLLFTIAVWFIRRRRKLPGHCSACGYRRDGLPPDVPCPECGTTGS